ncbi:ca2+ sensor protein [Sphingomonas sp.]|jgi:hypothetical protein|uniref:EF-hand domain-containing protein n=1 Tax=Sphingomonas sp. TaxID=28214 RepID=UPI002EDAEDE9
MKKLLFGTLLGTALLGGAAQASAQDRPQMFPDPNGDGVTTKDEMVAASEARFAGLDTDKNGKLSTAERQAGAGAGGGNGGGNGGGGGRGMGRADTDGDGLISLEEMRASAGMRFDRMDANKDGKIDATEIEAARARQQQRSGN